MSSPPGRPGAAGPQNRRSAERLTGTALPFLPPTAALVSGILFSRTLSAAPAAALAAALAFLAAAWFFAGRRKNGTAAALVLAVFAAAGTARTSLAAGEFDSHPLRRLDSPDYMDFTGFLYKSPGREVDRDILKIRVETVRHGDEEQSLEGNLRVAVPCPADSAERLKLLAGDRIRVSARLSSLRGFRNFGAFSYGAYLRTQRIHRSASTKTRLLVERTGGVPRLSPARFFSRIRTALQKKLETEFPSPDAKSLSDEGAVLEALLLGEDGRMSPATVLSLQETGLYHLFAISGGHIAIITFLLFSLLRFVRVRLRASYFVLFVFLVVYTLLVEAGPSVLRATIMTLAFLAGKLLWKDVHVLNTIAASAFVLLLANPFSLFDVGFQLTYAATLAIILFHPRIAGRLPRLPLRFSEMTALSLSAMLGVLPIIARNFNRITFSSIVLNYAAIPLTGLIMGLGYIYLPLAFLAPGPAGLLARALGVLVNVFGKISRALDPFPFFSYRIPTPGAVVVAGYFISLGLLLLHARFKGQRLIAAAAFVLFLFFLILHPFPSVSGDLKVTMIDVGQGDSLLVEFPGRRKMLVDGGGFPESSFDVGDKIVSPLLWRKGIRRIDYLVSTHPHPDHLIGLASVAANFRVREFWEGHPPGGNAVHARLRENLGRKTIRRRVFRGFSHRVGGVFVDVLHPVGGPQPADVDNDHSLVLRITLGEVSFLLAGDVGAAAEREILEESGPSAADVLKSPHHGSNSSSSQAFLDAVRPALVLVSVGEGNLFDFPRPDVLERYGKAGARVLRTDLVGAVEVATDGRRIRVRTAAGETFSFSKSPPVIDTADKMNDNGGSKTAMKIRKILALAVFPLLLVSFLQAQSLVELAKKEKERREALKEKAAVVTNVDLLRVKKKPAVEIVDPSLLVEQLVIEGEEVIPEVVGEETEEAEETGMETAAVEQAAQPQIIPQPEQPTMSEREFRTQLAERQSKVAQAQEMADLLTLKMNGLWQEFYSLDDMKSRELIQLQISDTYDKLTKAQMDTTKAQQELDDFLANARREGVPSIWIR